MELGPRTGAVTSALLERGVTRSRFILIEHNVEFVSLLRERFPGVCVKHRDALDVNAALANQREALSAVVSGLALLNYREAVRRRLIERSLHRLEPGAPFVQLSFGRKPPVLKWNDWLVRRAGRVFRSLPPATVWVYSSPAPSPTRCFEFVPNNENSLTGDIETVRPL